MVKVLYVGVYRDGPNGWAEQARQYILAMDSVGIEVVPRAVRLNQGNFTLPKRIEELEERSAAGCTHIIQHVLPNMMSYRAGMKNIGLVNLETNSCRRAGWQRHLNLLNEIWIPCNHNKQTLLDSGVTVPIMVVPTPVDITKICKLYPLPEQLAVHLKDKFVFYFIGTNETRKNLTALLKAFHSEFHPSEPVGLVIKTNVPIENLSKHVKENLKLRPLQMYKREIVIDGPLTDDQLLGLHQNLNCYVSTSCGEAVNLPVLDALLFNSTPIVGRHTAFLDYTTEKSVYYIDSHLEPCFGGLDNLPDLYSSEENWHIVSVSSLMKQMRAAYSSNIDERSDKELAGGLHAQKFCYSKIGQQIKELL